MALLIASATARELLALAPDLLSKTKEIEEMQPMQVKIKHGDAIFIATGVGPINASAALGFCFGLTHQSIGSRITIDAVIYAGLAGAFDLERNPLRSIWRVKREIWPEYGLNDGARVTAKAFSHPLWQRKDGEAVYDQLDLAEVAAIPGASEKKGKELPACDSLTVAGVSASFARRDSLWNTWHAELENMEGFAAAYVAARADVPLLEIRSVSNKVGPRSKAEKDFDGALQALGKVLPSLGLI